MTPLMSLWLEKSHTRSHRGPTDVKLALRHGLMDCVSRHHGWPHTKPFKPPGQTVAGLSRVESILSPTSLIGSRGAGFQAFNCIFQHPSARQTDKGLLAQIYPVSPRNEREKVGFSLLCSHLCRSYRAHGSRDWVGGGAAHGLWLEWTSRPHT